MKSSASFVIMTLALVGSCSLVAWQAQPTAPPTRTTRDGTYTDAQATRGATVYSQYCAYCHGSDLLGDPSNPPGQPASGRFPDVPSGSPPLRGRQFVSNWTGLTLSDLFARIRMSMPQDSPGSLSRQRNAEVLAFILSQNAYPSGLQELPFADAPLEGIRIVQ